MREHRLLEGCSTLLVGVSGGADSVALLLALRRICGVGPPRLHVAHLNHGIRGRAASADAAFVRQLAARFGLRCTIGQADVPALAQRRRTSLEAAAREARLGWFLSVARRVGADRVALAHTRDDQAEQVLLGLARGSGARSLAGMPSVRGIFRRPLLGVTRGDTRSLCEAANLPWWDDPMNDDPAYLRVKARRALADLEGDLGPGIREALARTADQLREDADHLDALADAAYATLHPVEREQIAGEGPPSPAICSLSTGGLAELPRAVRTRVWRRLLIAAGAPAGQVSARHTDDCDRLLTDWHGQGPIHVPGDLRVSRSGGRIVLAPG